MGFEIQPTVGIARVGNRADAFYFGPEISRLARQCGPPYSANSSPMSGSSRANRANY